MSSQEFRVAKEDESVCTVTDSACQLALARCGELGLVQAWCSSPLMSAQQSFTVSCWLLRSSLSLCRSSATTFCVPLLSALHTRPSGILSRQTHCLHLAFRPTQRLQLHLVHSDSRWRHFSSASISVSSELEVYAMYMSHLLRISLLPWRRYQQPVKRVWPCLITLSFAFSCFFQVHQGRMENVIYSKMVT